jgi:hypothetical protein
MSHYCDDLTIVKYSDTDDFQTTHAYSVSTEGVYTWSYTFPGLVLSE